MSDLGSGITLPPATFSWTQSAPTLLTSQAHGVASVGSGFSPQSVTGVATAIGGIVSAFGAMGAATAQRDQLKFQADMSSLNGQNAKYMGDLNARQAVNVGEVNARLAEMAAENELVKGTREYASFTLKKGRLKSSQRANLAANGIDLGVGSAAEELTTTDIMGEIDGQIIISNAVRSAWGYQTQAVATRASAAMAGNNYSASGNQLSMNANNSSAFSRIQSEAISPAVAGATSLLGSATRAADTWYKYKRDAAISSKFGFTLD